MPPDRIVLRNQTEPRPLGNVRTGPYLVGESGKRSLTVAALIAHPLKLLFPGGRGRTGGRGWPPRMHPFVQADDLAGDIDTGGRPKDRALLGAYVEYHGQTVIAGELIDHPDQLIAQCL